MKKFRLYYPLIQNHDLTKDLGLITFVMKKYYGYESSILAPKSQNTYPDAKKYLEDLTMDFYETQEGLIKYLEDTDILMLIGIYDFNLNIINYYKSIKPQGKIYLKLDASMGWMQNLNQVMNNDIIAILKKCDLITVENKKIQHYINSAWGIGAKYLPNGYYEFVDNTTVYYEEKENIIMFAGRIGSPEKANNILLEAFKNIQDEIKEWRLVFAGSIEKEFNEYINNYFEVNPHLKNRVLFLGKLEKLELKNLYKKSKVFCLTSLSEGSPNVLPESLANGCYFVSTDVGSVYEITDNGKYGCVFPINDTKSLEHILILLCNDDTKLKESCDSCQEYAKNKLNWIELCRFINDNL